MEIRASKLLSNICMLSALFLDPRYRFFITLDQEEAVKKHFVQLLERIKRLQMQPDSDGINKAFFFIFDDLTL